MLYQRKTMQGTDRSTSFKKERNVYILIQSVFPKVCVPKSVCSQKCVFQKCVFPKVCVPKVCVPIRYRRYDSDFFSDVGQLGPFS